MATRSRLAGSTDWAASGYWSGTTVPADTDDVLFDVGGDTIVDNYNQTGIDLNSLVEGPESLYNLGAAGTPIIIDVNNGGAGQVKINGQHREWHLQAGTVGTYPLLVHNPRNSSAKLFLTSSIVTALYQIAGQLILRGTVTGTNLYLLGGFATQDYASGTAWTNIVAQAGEHIITRAWSGTLTVKGSARVVFDDGNKGVTGGAVVIEEGGTFVHVNGNTGAVTHNGGVYDITRLAKSGLQIASYTALPPAKLRKNKAVDVTVTGSTSYPAGSPDISTGGPDRVA